MVLLKKKLSTWCLCRMFRIPLFNHSNVRSIEYRQQKVPHKSSDDWYSIIRAHIAKRFIVKVTHTIQFGKLHCWSHWQNFITDVLLHVFIRSLPSRHKLCYRKTVAICLLPHQFPANRIVITKDIKVFDADTVLAKRKLSEKVKRITSLVTNNAKQIGQISQT